MRFPPKIVSVLCVVQVFSVAAAFLLVGAFRKAHAKVVVENLHQDPSCFPSLAKFFYGWGPWLLLAPLAWGVAATVRSDHEGGSIIVNERQGLIGWALTCLILAVAASAVVEAFRGAFVYPFVSN